MHKVSVLIPTRGRVSRLRTLIPTFDETTKHDAELVFRCDDDDFATRDFLHAWGGHKVICGSRFRGYQSMPTFFNELAEASNGSILMCGNDDMAFKTKGWASVLLDAADRYPNGLYDLGVRTHNEEHYPFATVSRKVVDRLGFVWDPRIFWGDIYLRDVMQHFERCIKVPSVEIEHDWAGHNPDQTFHESDKDILSKDPTYWTGTHAEAVRDAVHKLKDLV